MKSKHQFTRKELSQFISDQRGDAVSVFQVRSNEKRWGLKLARTDLNSRIVRYDRDIAIRELRKYKVIPDPSAACL